MAKKVQVAADKILLSIDFIEKLAHAVVALNLSRRRTPDWLADVIFGWIENEGVILDPDGSEINIHDEIIDDAHGSDPSLRCIDDMKRKAKVRPARRPKMSMLLRLQLYDAAFKIIGTPISK
ncbi:hypothetical protein V5740_03300 [Croceibacterium sp. TMG7-5b_MA50]|uniref:hypothetical protein n=1 Tax=Croceibacterium sp. TMG7-5b_MA50 TaxID=3121290 RepID=UPI0032216D15